jgi:cell wall-associated NlpC family hydrolase
MTHIEDVLLCALAQKGDRYVFGAEVPLTAQDASAWDCSELVEWACGRAGVSPKVLDGAFNQWAQINAKGGLTSVAEGINTRGALLFVGSGKGVGREAITHVAFSLGDGTTIEARGKKWGVGCWPAANRFDFAGRIPGVDYGGGHAPLTTPPPAKFPPFQHLVKLGMADDFVRAVQQRLVDRGWKSITVNGVFDEATDRVVRLFQGEKALEVDGKVGSKTWEALWRAPIVSDELDRPPAPQPAPAPAAPAAAPQPAPTPAAPTPAGRTTTVQAGEGWVQVAERVFGDHRRAKDIQALNGGPTRKLHPGDVLQLP